MGYDINWEDRKITFSSKNVKFEDALLAVLDLMKAETNWFK